MIANLLASIISLVTFPGVILHEWSHKFICDRVAIPVHRVCYFRLGSPAGYIIHNGIENFGKMFLITIAPFLINTTLAVAIFFLAFSMPSRSTLFFVLCWLGISLAMHSFPSTGDLENLLQNARRQWRHNIAALLALPAVWLFKLVRLRDTIWLGLIHAVVVLVLTGLLAKWFRLVLWA